MLCIFLQKQSHYFSNAPRINNIKFQTRLIYISVMNAINYIGTSTKSAINKALKTFILCSQYPGRCAAQKAEYMTFK